jgi:hypothetical protein
MYDIIYNSLDGTINIQDIYDIDAISPLESTPYFNSVGDDFILSFINLEGVSSFSSFTYSTTGETENRYLTASYRISRDSNMWSSWYELLPDIQNFPVIDSMDRLFIDIKWVRGGSNTNGEIRLLSYNLSGITERNEVDGEATIVLDSGKSIIVKPPFIYKIFKISDIEIISKDDLSDVSIKYRFSQDTSRTWSEWEPFTKENIITRRINPIRFFQIEYSIENNSNKKIKIYDINLIGDFQNITNDYYKTNLYGIRECCTSNMAGSGNSSGNLSGNTCDPTTGKFPLLTDDQKSKLYNPYSQGQALNLLNKLSNDSQQVFGFKVEYFLTETDKKGQDSTLHEYQLFNVVCIEEIKVSVEGNNFPDSQIVMNQFDLNLFETMEVHITKDNFKAAFGPHRRPAKEDYLWFCDVNRMYQVDHAQQFRGFNNAAIYYKLILKKYNQKANVKAGTPEIKDRLKELTKNSTINELMGIENTQDKAAVANKDQTRTLTQDPIRLGYFAPIVRELIENSTTIISKSHYDMSGTTQSYGVSYKNLDPVLNVSDNIGFTLWFNINNYVVDEVYNFFNYYDDSNSIGWKINLSNDKVVINLNSDSYTMSLTGATISNTIGLEENTWYCYVANMDQRQRKLNQYIYKRNVEFEEDAPMLSSTVLKLVYSKEEDMIPVNYELEDISGKILGSDMNITNIRLFIDVIPKESHNKILNQAIIRDDSKYLVFADNANAKLILPSMPLGNEN